ncbi:hypothetical protein HZB88_04490 [archaeon]|nr:hypothetical protein [archaeon]
MRHSRATELYRLADENKISKETAIKFMGHSSDMSKTYTHLDKQEIKNMLKNQVYKLEELPEEKKHELEKEISELKRENERIWEALGKFAVKARRTQELTTNNRNTEIKTRKSQA